MHVLRKTRPADLGHLRSGSLGALLEGLIDYAGLFPPAGLPMESAVRNYAAYRGSELHWILGRFIVPVARLAEFENALAALPDEADSPLSWSLSVLAGADLSDDIARVLEFNSRHAADDAAPATISAIELKASAPEAIHQAHRIIPEDLAAFLEIPISGSTRACIAALSECGRNAKVRLGGETPELIPPAVQVTDFLQLCAAASLPFKATAGLHHPIRSLHNLTYAADSPTGTMHGFFNVFLASAFLKAGMSTTEATELLLETSPAAFAFDTDELGWRSHRLSRTQLADSRQSFSLSFGSCSFEEPVEDLHRLFPA